MKRTNTEGQNKSLPAAEVSVFCRQAAMMLKSGIPLYDGMEVLCRNYQDTVYHAVFERIYEGVQSGGTLYEGVQAAGCFPAYMVHMVQVGEMTGKLDDVLESLGDYYEKEGRLRTTIRNAVSYPLVLVLMMTVVIGILVIRVLPVFTDVFRSLGTELSGTAGAVLSSGVFLGRAVLVLVAVLLVLVAAVFFAWRLGKKEQILKICQTLCPPIRHLLEKQAAQRFASVVSMVLFSGYSLENALELLPDLMSDNQSAEKARRCQELLQENGDFPVALEQTGFFAPLHQKMIRVGVEAGRTDQVMEQVADIYEREVEEGIKGMVSWIEPALVGVLTLIIGGILLSVMLPLVSIMTSIG